MNSTLLQPIILTSTTIIIIISCYLCFLFFLFFTRPILYWAIFLYNLFVSIYFCHLTLGLYLLYSRTHCVYLSLSGTISFSLSLSLSVSLTLSIWILFSSFSSLPPSFSFFFFFFSPSFIQAELGWLSFLNELDDLTMDVPHAVRTFSVTLSHPLLLSSFISQITSKSICQILIISSLALSFFFFSLPISHADTF